MNRRGIILAIGVLMALIALTASSLAAINRFTAPPGAVRDQSNPNRPSTCRFKYWTLDDGNSYAAQTFTPNVTGQLTDVVLPVAGNIGSFTLSLTPVFPSGVPNVDSPIATTTATFAESTGGESPSIADASFASLPMVKAGTMYALVLTNKDAVTTGGKFVSVGWKIDYESARVDSDGRHCAGGAYSGGGAFAKGTGIPDPAGADFFFDTYVKPPPPPPPPPAKFRVTVVRNRAGTVTSVPASINCGTVGARCAASFSKAVTLVAKPRVGHPLLRWTVNGKPAGKALRLRLTHASRVTTTWR